MPGRGGRERRRFGRRSVAIHARVTVAGREPVWCVVRNISRGGALLTFDAAPRLPYYFRLEVAVGDGNLEAVCEVRNQTETTLGVEFRSAGSIDRRRPSLLDQLPLDQVRSDAGD